MSKEDAKAGKLKAFTLNDFQKRKKSLMGQIIFENNLFQENKNIQKRITSATKWKKNTYIIFLVEHWTH